MALSDELTKLAARSREQRSASPLRRMRRVHKLEQDVKWARKRPRLRD
jgi:hypothetical protein